MSIEAFRPVENLYRETLEIANMVRGLDEIPNLFRVKNGVSGSALDLFGRVTLTHVIRESLKRGEIIVIDERSSNAVCGLKQEDRGALSILTIDRLKGTSLTRRVEKPFFEVQFGNKKLGREVTVTVYEIDKDSKRRDVFSISSKDGDGYYRGFTISTRQRVLLMRVDNTGSLVCIRDRIPMTWCMESFITIITKRILLLLY
ncbi:MAG: hypothetical protein HY429_03135 [Candidatus Levybacteria bacterium]|nr:hypothetical protein [Candidatus Levybacteria bacterium]